MGAPTLTEQQYYLLGMLSKGILATGKGHDDIIIQLIESNHTQMRVKYNDDADFTVFNFVEDPETGIITYYCTKNGAIVVLTPAEEEDIIYKAMEA